MAVGNAMVTTAKFKPLTIAEWAAPLKEYAEQHQTAEEALNTLSADADEMERYVRENPNSEVARNYYDYVDAIEAQAENLARNGITPQIRTNLLGLKRLYNNSIKPIKRAVTDYQEIMTQRNKDYSKGIIGAPEISIGYLLEHPEYTKIQDRESYYTGENVYKTATDMFKGLNQFNTNPNYVMSEDGKFVSIVTPQSYSSDDIYTAFTGEGDGQPTEELINTVENLKRKYNYDSLNSSDKESFLYYAMQGAAKSIKNPKISNRAVPKGTKISSDGTVISNSNVPQFKGFTSITTDDGETLYLKNSQYYRATANEDGQYNMTPVTDDVIIGGKTFRQKSNSQPGSLAPADEKTLIKDFGYHSFKEESSGSPTSAGSLAGYERKEFGDLAQLKWDNIQSRVRNYVTSVMTQQGMKNYSFNPNDVAIYIKPKSGGNDYGLIIQIKNPMYKAPSNSAKSTGNNKPRGAALKD